MTKTPAVIVLGAGGTVGRSATALLQRQGLPIRLVVRRAASVSEDVASRAASVHEVDLADSTALVRSGAVGNGDVVLNCAGPAGVLSAGVARQSASVGASYVDPAGGRSLHAAVLQSYTGNDPRCWQAGYILGAGLSPGLDMLMLRHLTAPLQSIGQAVIVSGGCDVLGLSGAADYVSGIGDDAGTAASIWRAGGVTPDLVAREIGSIPYWDRPVRLIPFLTSDAQQFAWERRPGELATFSAIEAGLFLEELLVGRRTAASLSRAAGLDAAGRNPYYQLAAAASSADHGTATALVCRAPSAALLSAVVAVAAVRRLMDGAVSQAAGNAWRVLDPERVLATAQASGVEVRAVSAAPLLSLTSADFVLEMGEL